MAYLLDTSVAVHVRDGDRPVVERLAVLRGDVYLSLVTLIELQGGLATRPALAARRRRAMRQLQDEHVILPLDREVVDTYGELLGRLRFDRGKVLDRLIAATALVHELTLVTMNGADFRDIPSLHLEVWPAPSPAQ